MSSAARKFRVSNSRISSIAASSSSKVCIGRKISFIDVAANPRSAVLPAQITNFFYESSLEAISQIRRIFVSF
ncbi:MAG: hypothetical protein CL946_05630 [Ectothiorhodospiraceae bacterium]|nr:hypothetical protein [Ectothiorhodospiraceae bacterium]